jgi:hypothetical protein
MSYWSIFCPHCRGYLADALLECVRVAHRSRPGYVLLFQARSGAALACPSCGGLIGFDAAGNAVSSQGGWPVFRYGQAEMEAKRAADGEPDTTALEDWALRHRFTQPGTHSPLRGDVYAEQAPANETVP